MMNKKLFILLLFVVSIQPSFSQKLDGSKLDQYFQSLEANDKFMGSVAISKDRKIIYSKSIGFANRASNTRANENSKYRIGSISKTFTAVLVFKAIEEGKLTLNQTIGIYFPEIKNGEKITISNLLYHRSGIHNFTNNPDYLNWNTTPKSESEMVEVISKAAIDFEPDSKAEYSNSNYVLLSYVLAKVYHIPYSKLLDSYSIKPLKLKNTFFGAKINLKNNETYSYRFSKSWTLEPETDMSVPMGAGAVVSTPIDLIVFIEALFNNELISSSSLESMKTIKDKYGMGLFQFPFNDMKGFGHTGGIDGFSSILIYFPEDKVAYALTSNGSNFNNNNISIAALSFATNRPFEIPSFKTIEIASEELDKYLGIYSSKQTPLQITISKNGKTLMAQATGQSAFALEPTEKDKFKFEAADIVLEFLPSENMLILKQGGGEFTFTKS